MSYCYEGLGKYGDAARVLKPLTETAADPFQGELLRRLAWLYEKAGNQQEARKCWQKLAERPPSPALVPYLQEKLAQVQGKPSGKK
ncbi:MAG: tetratricopeptide repeat protein [Deltaproteobacteria bacterium]|nr:tetratricopeptide repeat protein [Deltaproteobacteria bacterium]